jgi:DNA-binding transcriptional regulator WhiA
MNKRYSIEEIEFIKKQRGRVSIKEISKALGRSYRSVQTKISKLGLSAGGRVDAPNVNVSFFEEWSQELAYMVGFFLADGHMANHSKTKHYGIFFSVGDKDIVEKIVNVCGYKNTVKKYIHKTTILSTMYKISMSSKFVWKFFESLGFTHRKTFTTRIPKQIPQEFMNHFIRGVFDGDGSIFFRWKHYPQTNIAGSELFINDVSKLGIEYSGINSRNNRTFTICYNGQIAIDFLNYIYKDATIYMDRKYKRYLKALKWRNSRNFWTEREIELLKEIGPVTHIDDLIDIFNRSCHSINVKARRLDIRIKEKGHKLWSTDDINLLKKIYPANSTRETAKILNRSLMSIQRKVYRLGLKRKYKGEGKI